MFSFKLFKASAAPDGQRRKRNGGNKNMKNKSWWKKRVKMGAIAIVLLLVVGGALGANSIGSERRFPSKVVEKTVELKKQTIQELIEDNKEYLEYLRKNIGPEAVSKHIRSLEEALEKVPYNGTTSLKLVEVGWESISFWPYTSDAIGGSISDPINLVFYNKGNGLNVNNKIDYSLTNSWDPTWLSNTQYTYIDDTAHGGSAYWERDSYTLANGPAYGTRYHIRIFNGTYDTHVPGFAYWSNAGVHKETWSWTQLKHIIDSWEEAETFIKNDFAGKSFVGSIGTTNLNNAGTFQGQYNDGNAPVIELIS